MSLKYKLGDLIAAANSGEVNVIAHGCNCFTTMGSGIAPLVKAAFPEAWKADLQTSKGDKSKLGSYSVGGTSSGLLVYNLYSQYGYSGRNKGIRDLDYNALYDSLTAMKKNLTVRGLGSEGFRVGLPKIGAGLAGGDWNVIEAMIMSVFESYDVTIYVLKSDEIPRKAFKDPELWLDHALWPLEVM